MGNTFFVLGYGYYTIQIWELIYATYINYQNMQFCFHSLSVIREQTQGLEIYFE